MITLAAVEERIRAVGLAPRGAFDPIAADVVPALPDGRPVGTLVLAGNAGPAMWRAFAAAPEAAAAAAGPEPLDAWTRRVVTAVAAEVGAAALFPFGGPPHLPFPRWAKRAEPVHDSPLGMLVHPDHGLWHAYRGALAFAAALPLPPRAARPRPCDACPDRPCLTACPVGAFAGGRYDVDACARHLAAPAGADCRELGCRARRACPVGRAAAYEPAQAGFHMQAFLRHRS